MQSVPSHCWAGADDLLVDDVDLNAISTYMSDRSQARPSWSGRKDAPCSSSPSPRRGARPAFRLAAPTFVCTTSDTRA
jgi:hypothetical protein